MAAEGSSGVAAGDQQVAVGDHPMDLVPLRGAAG